jgi:hypothetical protein
MKEWVCPLFATYQFQLHQRIVYHTSAQFARAFINFAKKVGQPKLTLPPRGGDTGDSAFCRIPPHFSHVSGGEQHQRKSIAR